jgi:hypothetical protein
MSTEATVPSSRMQLLKPNGGIRAELNASEVVEFRANEELLFHIQ